MARASIVFALLSAVFFVITATTFASLGVVLPAMIAEFEWSWAKAGLGFTVLALFTGLFSPAASLTLNRLGPRANYALGGAAMVAGFALLATLNAYVPYLIATALLGAGFALLANVPSVFVIARLFAPERRARLIGVYLAAGGLGGVAGPAAASAVLAEGGDWRLFWVGAGVAIGLLSTAAAIAVSRRSVYGEEAESSPHQGRPAKRDWTLAEAARSPAFFAISAALLIAYLCGVSVSAWAATHMQALGLSAATVGALLSLHAAANAGARALGGLLAQRIAARTLLATALAAELVGMAALAVASSLPAAVIFALCEGYAFGMALFATTVLQIEYFGLKHSPAILGAMNLAATAAMVGPVLTGAIGDATGSFAPAFLAYAALSAVAAVFILAARDPNRTAAS
jgi:MFS family permease